MTIEWNPPEGLRCTVSAAEEEALNQDDTAGQALVAQIDQAREAYERIHGPSCKVTLVALEIEAGGS